MCNRTGRIILYGCPLKTITADIWEARPAFDFAEDGVMPINAGYLEQSTSFMDAYAVFKRHVRAHTKT
ncbi:MAG: hypothetical protein QM754_18565 [Tepidisphaeraceae bacterium]